MTESATWFSEEPAFNKLIISSSYVAGRAITGGARYSKAGSVLNPAIAIGSSLT